MIPTLEEIKEFRIVVTTLITSRILSLKGLECGHFSHIIIDEAAQVYLGQIFDWLLSSLRHTLSITWLFTGVERY